MINADCKAGGTAGAIHLNMHNLALTNLELNLLRDKRKEKYQPREKIKGENQTGIYFK